MCEESKDNVAAEEALASLNAESESAAADASTFRVGQLIKEAAKSELPDANPDLRAMLIENLDHPVAGIDGSHGNEFESKRISISTDNSRSRNWGKIIAIAAMITLLVGGVFIVSNDYYRGGGKRHRQNVFAGVDLALEEPAVVSNETYDDVDFQKFFLETENKSSQTAEWLAQVSPEQTENQAVTIAPENGTATLNDLMEIAPTKSKQLDIGFVFGVEGKDVKGKGQQAVESTKTPRQVSAPQSDALSVAQTLRSTFGDKIKFVEGGSTNVAPRFENDEANKHMMRQLASGSKRPKPNYYFEAREGTRPQTDAAFEAIAIKENSFVDTEGTGALSTFSVDVDTAAYSNMRRFIVSGQKPNPNSIRIEELINYFQYDYAPPKDDKPFAVSMEVASCPWQTDHKLVRVGIKGKTIHRDERPASNIVFLLDVSGSMKDSDKLPLLQRGLTMMLDRLNENDRVSIVTYAGEAGVRLLPTSGDQKIKIRNAVDGLTAAGSTNGSAGIEVAYKLAAEEFIKGGTNRVILATDGDLNVGITEDNALIDLIKEKAKDGVFLTVLGLGNGNLKDSKLEKLADNGNGSYAFIDSMREARRVLVEQMSGSLVTIAKDVKLQVEFNPSLVKGYRLIGYENRTMANADFKNDKKDAGEIGAGHTVTAIYEIAPARTTSDTTLTAKLKYQAPKKKAADEPMVTEADSNEMLTLAIRFKLPESNESDELEFTLDDSDSKFYEASGDFQFASAVASFGMLLRDSKYSGNATFDWVEEIAVNSMGEDPSGYRAEFVDLIRLLQNN
ncbi:MAG: von Willebrand factor type A domain-containing protein [Mariniblastus sp.]